MDPSLLEDAREAHQALRAGRLRGPALLERILAIPFRERDSWTDALLGLPEPPPDVPELPSGAVPYLPAGVDEILTMTRECPLRSEDHFVDLGSGMGRVAVLVHLLSGARATGVELQAPLVSCARTCCDRLGLRDVSFIQADAADVEVDGSVFFLYSPFNGDTLARVLRRLRRVAAVRPIALCTVCLELPGESWLRPRGTSCASMTVYDAGEGATAPS